MDQYKYQETMANIRHYSSLRFAMITVFVAITGGLLSIKYSQTIVIDVTFFTYGVIKIAGLWISSVFFIFEIALNFYLAGFWSDIGVSDKPYRSFFSTWGVRFAAISLPVVCFVFWASI